MIELSDPARMLRAVDGTPLAVYDGDVGASERLFFSHATGFCAAAWAALVDEVGAAWTAWDFRGHGRSGGGHVPVSWWEMGDDVRSVRDATPAERSIGVGHSMGGAALVMAQLDDPGRFDALVLYEPIITPPPFRRMPEHLLARLALKRRSEFASRAEARQNYAAKPPFSRWDERALDGYLATGLADVEGGVRLACDPRFEAEVFTAAGAHGVADRVAELDIPVVVVVGEETETYPDRSWPRELVDRMPGGELVVVPATGHFGPMDAAAGVADVIGDVIGR